MKNIKRSVCILCILAAFLGIAGLVRAITYQDIIDEIANNNISSVYDIGLNTPFSKDKSGMAGTFVYCDNGKHLRTSAIQTKDCNR